MSRILDANERFQRWFRDSAVPLWAAKGYDHERGGFYEALDDQAAPVLGQPRRVRVQARQIYTFTQIARLGLGDGALAEAGFDFFLDRCCPDEGDRGCVHLISDDGEIVDDRRDLYDQAFLLLACAARIEYAGDERANALAERTVAFLEASLRSPSGGWLESDLREAPRRQNPHMHLFEAFMALHRATHDPKFLENATHICELFENRFYSARERVLIEYFEDDLKTPTAEGRTLIEPGHMMEWVWLLNIYDRMTGSDHSHLMNALFTQAKVIGRSENGFLKNHVLISDLATPGGQRLWPQTEYLKAATILAGSGSKSCEQDAEQIIDQLFSTYLDQNVDGLWHDELDRHGNPVDKAIPASILYHLFEAVHETDAYCQRVKAQ